MERIAASGNEPPVVRRWEPRAACVGRAREELRRSLALWGLLEVEDAAVLVLSELLTNAVVHARVPPGRQIETRFLPTGRGVRIQVDDADGGWRFPRPQDGQGGHGLLLVDALAQRWGVSPRDGVGKSVWALVEVPDQGGGDGGDGVRIRVWARRVLVGDRVVGEGWEREVVDVREDREGGRAEVVVGFRGGAELRVHAGGAVDVVRRVRW
ncbi:MULTISPECIES: ATP-binding protein [Streptomyces]|uniref:ATP-binding protein n=1 Tax=Streptomyces TaxID=1883 RepID=UPI001CCED651|nr:MULTISPECIES: ATP-binding protein [Streptomyces]UBI38135.1 ATP-binding protein [Streptomyces mobaraensis]UKW30721.1 ATP-binding protein [Streptomyces sp. TYQ1024]